MATMHDLVIRCLNLDARRTLDWLPKIPEGTGEGGATRFTDDALRRKLLRLMANSAVEVLRVRTAEEHYYSTFRSTLLKVRRMNSWQTASAATSRLMRLFDLSVEEFGENAGNEFYSAANLAEMLSYTYTSWTDKDSYDDTASHYSTVVGSVEMSPTRQELVTKMLAELKRLEENN